MDRHREKPPDLPLHALLRRLRELRCQPHTPSGDLEWLELRVLDTLEMTGHWRAASIANLHDDLASFETEFPGLVGPLVRSPGDQDEPPCSDRTPGLAELPTIWARAGRECELALWALANDVRGRLDWETPEGDVCARTLHLLWPLLDQGLLRAVDLLEDGGLGYWEGSAASHIQRIEREWCRLDRPPSLGDIAWFVGER